jgi:predicted small metal-binding protein
LAKVVCLVEGCGKMHDKDTVDEVLRSLQAHLTRKHRIKGDAYNKAMNEAIYRAMDSAITSILV